MIKVGTLCTFMSGIQYTLTGHKSLKTGDVCLETNVNIVDDYTVVNVLTRVGIIELTRQWDIRELK